MGGSVESRVLVASSRPGGGVRGGATEARPASDGVEIRRDPTRERLGREGEGVEARDAGRDGAGLGYSTPTHSGAA